MGDSYNRPDDVCSCLDALIHKASHAFKIQTSIHDPDAQASYIEISASNK
jgi:hypothetical protein